MFWHGFTSCRGRLWRANISFNEKRNGNLESTWPLIWWALTRENYWMSFVIVAREYGNLPENRCWKSCNKIPCATLETNPIKNHKSWHKVILVNIVLFKKLKPSLCHENTFLLLCCVPRQPHDNACGQTRILSGVRGSFLLSVYNNKELSYTFRRDEESRQRLTGNASFTKAHNGLRRGMTVKDQSGDAREARKQVHRFYHGLSSQPKRTELSSALP